MVLSAFDLSRLSERSRRYTLLAIRQFLQRLQARLHVCHLDQLADSGKHAHQARSVHVLCKPWVMPNFIVRIHGLAKQPLDKGARL